ncbi:LysM peptidoglycan-binding domain-containing protein [Cysteiniphilum halobium]|uniref:LysM peptidoglycan-binding domain-containing protein n=1 Tax=Cysteiniphilum halobium TaxID=2219059 RepID=UPI003F83C37B
MQKKLYIIAISMLLLSGCAQLDSKSETATTNITTSPPSKPASVANAPSLAKVTKTSQTSVPSANAKTVKVVAKAHQTNTQKTSTIARVVEHDQPTTYKVEIGDSLYSIARKNNISLTCLAKANNIKDPNRLAAGQNLIIPKPTDC